MIDTNRLAGHSLPHEGRIERFGYLGNGEGETACTCGVVSPVLESSTQRRRWHRRHKDIVRAAELAASPLVDATVGINRQA